MKYLLAVLAIMGEILVCGWLSSEIGLRGGLRGLASVMMCGLFVATWRAITKKRENSGDSDGGDDGEKGE